MEEVIQKKISEYQELFGLKNWTLRVMADLQLDANARTLADPRYYKADITFNPSRMNISGNYDEVIIHELIHIVMALYDFYADNLGKEGSDELFFVARENAVSQLTHIMMRILKK